MRGYFDEDEPEPERPRRDTELTLGAGALLGLTFALLLVCGLCFGVGYAVGHHTSTPSDGSQRAYSRSRPGAVSRQRLHSQALGCGPNGAADAADRGFPDDA